MEEWEKRMDVLEVAIKNLTKEVKELKKKKGKGKKSHSQCPVYKA